MIVDEYFDEIALPILSDPIYLKMKDYYAHGSVTVFEHCLSVAIYAYEYAKERDLDVDYKALIRGALLHDFYLYDWHKSGEGHKFHGFRHPFLLIGTPKSILISAKKKGISSVPICSPLSFGCFPVIKKAALSSKAIGIARISKHSISGRRRRKHEKNRTYL